MLPIKGTRYNGLYGNSLSQLQLALSGIKYLKIEEYSVIDQKRFARIDRCKQATCVTTELSIVSAGDIAQLPPISAKVFYHLFPTSHIALQ